MNKADRERLERRKRMLAREQGTLTDTIPGTSGDIGLRTPKPIRRRAAAPAGQQPPAENVKSLEPLFKKRQRRRMAFVTAVIVVLALFLAGLTGTLSASIALLADSVDSAALYLNRSSGGWPVNTGISDPVQIEELAGGFVELGSSDAVVYSPYGVKAFAMQPGYARPVLAVGGTHFTVYNRAGNELTVASRTAKLYTQTFDNSILLCAMSNNNSLAVVTELSRYTAQLRVYDAAMHQTYNWQTTQTQGTPIAVAFSPDNRRFAAGTLAARQGQLQCSIYFMDTASEEEGVAYKASQGSMLMKLDWQTESRAVAVFDSYLAVLDPRTGAEVYRYDFGGATLQSVAAGRRQTALLLNIRGGNSLVTLDYTLTPMAEIPARQAYGISATDTDIYLLCADAVECYGYDGVRKWTRSDLPSRPLAVINTRETLVFTGTRAEILHE